MRYLLAILTVFSFIHVSPAQASVAPLFHVENFTCGTNNDWKDMSLTFDEDGNVIVSNVTFNELWKETKMGDSGMLKHVVWPMSLTVTNDTDTRLPIWIGSTIRLVYDDNLLTIGLSRYDSQGNPDYDMKLLHPGTNQIEIENETSLMVYAREMVSVHQILEELSNPPTFGCLSIGVAIE